MKNNLKEVMTEKKLSIQEFANIMDVSLTTVNTWRKSKDIRPKTQRKIAKALKVDVSLVFEL